MNEDKWNLQRGKIVQLFEWSNKNKSYLNGVDKIK